jgi:hypothetical protein
MFLYPITGRSVHLGSKKEKSIEEGGMRSSPCLKTGARLAETGGESGSLSEQS